MIPFFVMAVPSPSLRCLFIVLVLSSVCHSGVIKDALNNVRNKVKELLTGVQKSVHDLTDTIKSVKEYREQMTDVLKNSCKHPPGLIRFLGIRKCISSFEDKDSEAKCRQMFDSYACIKKNITSMCDPKEEKHTISDLLGFFKTGIAHLCKQGAKQLDDFKDQKGTECLSQNKKKYFQCWRESFKKVKITNHDQRCKAAWDFKKCFTKEMSSCKRSAALIADQVMTKALKQTTCKGCLLLPQLSSILVALAVFVIHN